MQEPLSFDPDYYFDLVAGNLLKNLGEDALLYADQALTKMKALGDEEGLSMWLSIHEHLANRTVKANRPKGVVLH
ncbi:hypothetical protein [Kordiimonas pumila]|uniref:Uncharacterized protein n=1 Tax=Kordiimonas pumila TaxID=2161677 RepID=A0ABV7D062_9PROT|nr:hypothetical protein [Kordiimonas pumila]